MWSAGRRTPTWRARALRGAGRRLRASGGVRARPAGAGRPGRRSRERLGESRGLPAAALAAVCGYAGTSGAYPLTAQQVAQVLADLAPAEAATHVQHPNTWSWRELLAAAGEDSSFVAFYLARKGDAPQSPEQAQFVALAVPSP